MWRKIRFIVKRQVSGGVNFKLLPVTIKLGGQARDVTTEGVLLFKNITINLQNFWI